MDHRLRGRYLLIPARGALYGVLIGLEIDGQLVLGAVNLPALNELVYAARAFGCFWNGAPARVSRRSERVNEMLIIPAIDLLRAGVCASHRGRKDECTPPH